MCCTILGSTFVRCVRLAKWIKQELEIKIFAGLVFCMTCDTRFGTINCCCWLCYRYTHIPTSKHTPMSVCLSVLDSSQEMKKKEYGVLDGIFGTRYLWNWRPLHAGTYVCINVIVAKCRGVQKLGTFYLLSDDQNQLCLSCDGNKKHTQLIMNYFKYNTTMPTYACTLKFETVNPIIQKCASFNCCFLATKWLSDMR